jgi:hypothetical protein
VLLDPAAPSAWPTDGILCWLGLVIADYTPAWDPAGALVVSASLFALLELVPLLVLCQHHLRLIIQVQTMDHNEMAIDSSNDCCPPADTSSMDVDVDMENCREQAVGLPFPGGLLADGSFTIEYHDM